MSAGEDKDNGRKREEEAERTDSSCVSGIVNVAAEDDGSESSDVSSAEEEKKVAESSGVHAEDDGKRGEGSSGVHAADGGKKGADSSQAKAKGKKEYLPDFPYSFRTVLLALLAVSALLFVWAFMFHPSMRVETITVNGNYEFSDAEIAEALGIHAGDHILKFTGSGRRSLRRSTPYIEKVSVKIRFPSEIVIDVTERHKLAYIKVPDGYAAIDDEGLVLEFISSSNTDIHPVLCGLDVDNIVIGRTCDVTDSLKFRKMILVLGAVLDADVNSTRNDGYSFYESVREVRAVPSGLIFMTIELPDDTVLQVKLNGIETIADDMQWLLYSIRADAFEGLPAGSLDMTEEEKIYRAYDSYLQ